jgi:hypothetical protein
MERVHDPAAPVSAPLRCWFGFEIVDVGVRVALQLRIGRQQCQFVDTRGRHNQLVCRIAIQEVRQTHGLHDFEPRRKHRSPVDADLPGASLVGEEHDILPAPVETFQKAEDDVERLADRCRLLRLRADNAAIDESAALGSQPNPHSPERLGDPSWQLGDLVCYLINLGDDLQNSRTAWWTAKSSRR